MRQQYSDASGTKKQQRGIALPSFERLHSLSGCLFMILVLGACSSNQPVPAPPSPAPKKAGPSAEAVRRGNVNFFLKRAEQALRKGHLTQPAGASAYDYYLRVQQLDPGNRGAQTGIQTIVVTYVEQAREALRRRAFGEVQTLLKRAEMLAPGNALVAEVRENLLRERGRARLDLPEGESIGLPAAELNARSKHLSSQLDKIAQRIRKEQLRVIIVARDDAEGRWIYQQLREAVPGYRVRGDIKVGSPARLVLVKPSGGVQ
ncbi:N-acetylglucosaminyltransferase [Microbulbifer sp. MLAF003]|uniref:N-acetylglucosaminyltransferase n=1 Tax=Microbulbifer sp. MLAF003 TaxID=3032582 RepID=UPI0024AC9AAC|nr:N-acetylglucosaminyltransferase [Microbulbifer sp. MLAF003]WHI50830.1 N-acetylglucosaminyltransferase [Microbulbifer sp. MLAF003]